MQAPLLSKESPQNKIMRPPESMMPRAKPIPVVDNDYQKIQPVNVQQPPFHSPRTKNSQNHKLSSFIQELPSAQNHQQLISEQNFGQPLLQKPVQFPPNKPPLILSPQHCTKIFQIKYYANMYSVKDIEGWVKKNCTFAKMFLPRATCEEINILVASCHL
uniref:aECM cysteine-cradle domain-containing protein n=1 Tax=Syphacia muris TaxID=451379 RepID=A0A0N5ALY9_9BILA